MKIWKWIKNLFKKNSGQNPKVKPELPVTLPELPESEVIPLPVEPPSENAGEIADFKFVDSSHHHPDFDAVAYAKVSKLLINKTSQGLAMVDRTHATRQKLCKENGIIYGGYHFYECNRSWKAQLDHYLKVHGEFVIGPIIDFETWSGKQEMNDLKREVENLYSMLLEAERLTGKRAIIYAGYHVLVALNLPSKFSRFIFWVPRYNSTIGKLPAPVTVENLMAWQFTESGAFPGFKDGNDVNLYFGKVNLLNLKTI